MSNPSLSDLKTYLGISGDDALLTSSLAAAVAQVERDTERTFSYASNRTSVYSTNGDSVVGIRDIPRTDATRVVTLFGTTLTEETGYWLLPDRRNPDVSVSIQLRPFDRTRADWYKSDPLWWDKNLDQYGWGPGMPNDLSISSAEGHPTLPADVTQEMTFLGGWFYYRAKAGASGIVTSPSGLQFDVSGAPAASETFVRNWMSRTYVASI